MKAAFWDCLLLPSCLFGSITESFLSILLLRTCGSESRSELEHLAGISKRITFQVTNMRK